MGSDDKLMKASHPTPATREQEGIALQREQVELEVRQKKIDAAVKVVDLLVRGGHVFLEVAQGAQATKNAIALLDAQTSAELLKLEKLLRGEQNKTERLRIVADLASKGNLDPVLTEAFAQALRSTFPVQ